MTSSATTMGRERRARCRLVDDWEAAKASRARSADKSRDPLDDIEGLDELGQDDDDEDDSSPSPAPARAAARRWKHPARRVKKNARRSAKRKTPCRPRRSSSVISRAGTAARFSEIGADGFGGAAPEALRGGRLGFFAGGRAFLFALLLAFFFTRRAGASTFAAAAVQALVMEMNRLPSSSS